MSHKNSTYMRVWALMAFGRVLVELSVLFAFFTSYLSWNTVTNQQLGYNGTLYAYDAHLKVLPKPRKTYQAFKRPVVQWSKHGGTTIALPPMDHFYGLDFYFLCCEDVHPLPGPKQQHVTATKQRITYSSEQLSQLKPTTARMHNVTYSAFTQRMKSFNILRHHSSKSASLTHVSNAAHSVAVRIRSRPITRRRNSFIKPKNLIEVLPTSSRYANQQVQQRTKTNANPNKIMGSIPVRITSHSTHHKNKTRVNNTRNASVCIHVPLITNSSNENNNRSKRPNFPSFSLINARSLFPKLDELTALLVTNPVDIAAVTETWLHKDINDNLVSINGYSIHRNVRVSGRGGGACVYTSKSIPCQRGTELESADFECIWLWIRPPCLPRPLTGIILCVVYNPPDRSAQELRDLDEYLVNTTNSLRNKYPDCGLAILGDFNNFGAPKLLSGHNLKQVVHLPTRGSATLDLIITNLQTLYDIPRILAPLGSADHSIVLWLPIAKNSTSHKNITKPMKRLVRRHPLSQIDTFWKMALYAQLVQ